MKYQNLVVGITGGIGSGKSTFCEILTQNNFPVIHSDNMAKEIMATDDAVKKRIIETLGTQSYFNDGKINTHYLRDIVFNDFEKLQILNSIVHPAVIKKTKEKIEDLKKNNHIIFVESALIYEANFDKLFDFIILIYSEQRERLRRVKQRSNLTDEEILKIMQTQIPDEEKRKYADIIVENNDNIDDLKNRAKFILTILNTLLL
ncbi:MAG TPA: dephospho-CoA kinase [Ignavibacteriales bacterium]|nr:dephospho-CoA kinase [Ignavibacteriales bacterium]